MLKDILLNLDVDSDPHATTNFAISVARIFDAHVSGIAFAYDMLPPYESTAAELVNAERERSEAAAQGAISHLEEAARGSGVLVESHIIRASFANAPDIFARFARIGPHHIAFQFQRKFECVAHRRVVIDHDHDRVLCPSSVRTLHCLRLLLAPKSLWQSETRRFDISQQWTAKGAPVPHMAALS